MKANCRRILKALTAEPMTSKQLAETQFMGYVTAWRWVKHLLDAKLIHVQRMVVDHTGGPLASVYAIGPAPAGHVVKTPKLTTDLDRTRRYRKRMRESGDWQDTLARQRTKYWTNKAVKPDALAAAFF